jgi:hypothetical protein
MADWNRTAEGYFPGEQINNAWELHLQAAQLLIDRYFDVSVHLKLKSGGFVSLELANVFDDLDAQAADAAKAFMAERFAAAVMVDDVRTGSGSMLTILLEEDELAAYHAAE